jgi:dolichol-phosphate mannosyltransferase
LRSSNFFIVIATFNEIESLPLLVDRLVNLFPDARILVIDDGSPDGTGNWCDLTRAKYPQLSVVHRHGKQGLGSAAFIGFEAAIDQNMEFVATMDADLSHDPEELVNLLVTIQKPGNEDVGLVIGSRYIPGGKIIGWPWRRKVVSGVVNLYTRLLLRLTTKDNSGAFRVYRTDALKRIDLRTLRSNGYGYLEEILWHLHRTGVKVLEVPITFRDRRHGDSKTSLSTGVDVFWQITRLGFSRLRR